MVRQTRKILLVLPWSEPDQWVFKNHFQSFDVDVCSVPELHANRTVKGILQCTLRIAGRVKSYDCIVSWEATAAIATAFARYVGRCQTEWVALGIIPKSTNTNLTRILTTSLSNASVVTCFSNHDIATLRETTGVAATTVTPTVWKQIDVPIQEKSMDWLAVGASNRDDKTLARAAEVSKILVSRYARHVTHASDALKWHIDANQQVVENAFLSHRYHLAVLQSSKYASGLSIAVRAGFARQLLIASDTPHVRELIRDGENGLLVKLGDSEHLAEMIRMVQNGDVNAQKLAGALREDCQDRNSYDVLRHHIEAMVHRCF